MSIFAIDYNGVDPKFPRVFASPERYVDTGTLGITGTHEEICAQLKAKGQELADSSRILLSDLPEDDPDRVANPNKPIEFWDGDYLVTRLVVVESVVFDGTRYIATLKSPG